MAVMCFRIVLEMADEYEVEAADNWQRLEEYGLFLSIELNHKNHVLNAHTSIIGNLASDTCKHERRLRTKLSPVTEITFLGPAVTFGEGAANENMARIIIRRYNRWASTNAAIRAEKEAWSTLQLKKISFGQCTIQDECHFLCQTIWPNSKVTVHDNALSLRNDRALPSATKRAVPRTDLRRYVLPILHDRHSSGQVVVCVSTSTCSAEGGLSPVSCHMMLLLFTQRRYGHGSPRILSFTSSWFVQEEVADIVQGYLSR